jgi:hypothetical protein
VYQRYLPTFSEIIALGEQPQQFAAVSMQQADRPAREWYGAIAALNVLLQQSLESAKTQECAASNNIGTVAGDVTEAVNSIEGVVLSGPLPVLVYPQLISRCSVWTLQREGALSGHWPPLQLLPSSDQAFAEFSPSTLWLAEDDPLTHEQFCLVLTPKFSLVMALQEAHPDAPTFQFSFNPDVVEQAWRSLRSRTQTTNPQALQQLDALVEQFTPAEPSYRIVSDFTRLILDFLPDPIEWRPIARERSGSPLHSERLIAASTQAVVSNFNHGDRFKVHSADWDGDTKADRQPYHRVKPNQTEPSLDDLTAMNSSSDAELLEAIAHEVRTPLTTIRTLTRLLLKRKELEPDIICRLEAIDRECTKQIDRFSLIFRAVELETRSTNRPASSLAKISVAQVFQHNIPRWQQQAQQRNLTLDVLLPQKLPMVMSDPTILTQMLTGLIDRITSTLPAGSHIQVRVMPAGSQLKLQFYSQPQPFDGSTSTENTSHQRSGTTNSSAAFTSTLKSVGHLLMFQPETGNLSLNLTVTKNLFQALGGKLTVRQHPQQGEVLTIFLPLESPGILA